MKTYSNKTEEILDILQEECAEVIQAISKIRRFGMDNVYLKGEGTQREQLVKELGDVALLIDLLEAHQLFSPRELNEAKLNKATKLSKWSNIYKD